MTIITLSSGDFFFFFDVISSFSRSVFSLPAFFWCSSLFHKKSLVFSLRTIGAVYFEEFTEVTAKKV